MGPGDNHIGIMVVLTIRNNDISDIYIKYISISMYQITLFLTVYQYERNKFYLPTKDTKYTRKCPKMFKWKIMIFLIELCKWTYLHIYLFNQVIVNTLSASHILNSKSLNC